MTKRQKKHYKEKERERKAGKVKKCLRNKRNRKTEHFDRMKDFREREKQG
jgi:hypothetical protein